jgi:branched-chain amino acid aminotransferase
MSADEVFMTNSIAGIRWVGSYRQKRYFSNLSKKLIELLNQEL